MKTLRKVIKKLFRVLLWTTGVLVLLIIGGYFALRSPAVQTWISQRVADYLSDELGTKVTVGGVDIEFFEKVVLEDIYVEDRHQDTLLFAQRLKVDINTFSYGQRFLDLGDISLTNTKVKIKKYVGEHGLNYGFIEDYFASDDTTRPPPKKHPWKVNFGGLTLTNVDFAYIDLRDTINDPGMDYENIRVNHINAKIGNIDPQDTILQFNIVYMSALERSGFTLRNMSAHVTSTPTQIQLDNLNIRTPESDINGFIGFTFNSIDDIQDDFVHKVKMDGHFFNTALEMGDLTCFSTDLKGIRKRIYLSGDITGKVDRLRCKDIEVRFGERSLLSGDFSFNGLPDINQTNMQFKLKEMVTNKADIEGIPIAPFEKGKYVEVPDGFAELGDMHFKGSFEGFIYDFVAQGECRTAIGNVKMRDFAFVDNGEGKLVEFEGREVLADNFDIGRYLGISDMGAITANVKLKGSGYKKEDISSHIEGLVNSFVYNKYSYRNMEVNGDLSRNNFKGNLSVHDNNIGMLFNGNVNFSGKLPIMNFDAKIGHANLGALHFMDTKDSIDVTAHTIFNITGNDLDNLIGKARVLQLEYTRNADLYKVDSLVLYASKNGTDRHLALDGDFITAKVDGNYTLNDLPASLNELFSHYLPAYFTPRKSKKALPEEQLTYDVSFRGNTRGAQIVMPDLEIDAGTNMNGQYKSSTGMFTSNFTSGGLSLNGKRYENIKLNATSNPTNFIFSGSMSRLQMSDSLWLGNINTIGIAAKDTLGYVLNWNNNTKHKNDGSVKAQVHFLGAKSIEMVLRSAVFHIEDSLWTAAPMALMRMDSSRIAISRFLIRSGTQSVGLDGVIADNTTDQLYLTMNKFNLGIVNRFTGNSINMRGIADGRVGLSDLYHDVVFNSNIDFANLTINKKGVGDGSIAAKWDPQKKAIYVNGSFDKTLSNKEKFTNLLFSGYYYPKLKENSLDIQVDVKSMDLDMFAPYVKEYCSVFSGQYSGIIKVTGTPDKPKLNGELQVNAKKINIDFLGTYISFQQQTIKLEADDSKENSFYLEAFRVLDPHGDTAIVYGHLYHDHLSNFQLDFDMELKHFQVLNTTQEQNDLYFGNLFTTGFVNISGFVDNIRIDADVTTDKAQMQDRNRTIIYSSFNIPMESVQEVSDHEFITFKKDTAGMAKNIKSSYKGVTMDLKVTATPDCQVKVIFDPKVGDEITAKGNGDLRLTIATNGDLKLYGPYRVQSGSYLFTLKNLINKFFKIEDGGTIEWSGDPYKADINMTATYQVNTSVKPFFPYDSLEIYKRQYPVNVRLNLKGDLMQPAIDFDVNLPSADPSVQEGVARFLQTEQERNKQVFALMVMNSFITPQEYRELGYSAGNNNAFASTGSELLSAQISNWLSQISKDFNLGVKYRPNDELSKEELRVYMGTQVLNDRLTIDGNFGVVNQATNNVVGDVNIEYKLTNDGKVRLKGFNRSLENTVNTSGATYTQGVGIFYREDFDTVGELYRRYLDWLKKGNPHRTKEVKVPDPPPAPATK